ncbi:MAG: hypothetical protein M1834_002835 [Cirrosporium novae-zelandiae]|nr:MAG: hypothetical protein M1834_002835 [Cirrosporium novae-zelandiae]
MRRFGFRGAQIIWRCAPLPIYRPTLTRLFHSTSLLYRNDSPDDEVKINLFEQDSLNSLERRKYNPDEDEAALELKRQIVELEKRLHELKKVGLAENSPLLEGLTEDQKKEAREIILKYRRESGNEFPLDEFGNVKPEHEADSIETSNEIEGLRGDSFTLPDTSGFDAILKVPLDQQIHLKELVTWLKRASEDPTNDIHRKEVWRWYSRCKFNLPALVGEMPSEAWNVLWSTQSQVNDLERIQRLKTLAEDMIAGGRELSPVQELLYIEVLFKSGEQESAFERWKKATGRLKAHPDTSTEYWSFGITMVASQKEPQQAEEMAISILKYEKDIDRRILIPIIGAWTRSCEPSKFQHAWALYMKVKEALGNDMTMDDYDKISIMFLHSARTDLALAVFRDMMLTGKATSEDSSALYRRALGLSSQIQTLSLDEAEVNKVSLTALTILPRRLQNKFFYASWMKKLIGMGEADSAAQVIELMYERGVKPDARHLNGIMAAWLRKGQRGSVKKAKEMGWAMIQKRLELVMQRQQQQQQQPQGDQEQKQDQTRGNTTTDNNNPPIPFFLQRLTPPATIETFSILLFYYTRHPFEESSIPRLRTAMSAAQIQPNSYFLNHLFYHSLRAHSIDPIWTDYTTTLRLIPGGAGPDLQTFACLWDCQKARLSGTAKSSSFPAPRRLFAEMSENWFSTLPTPIQETYRQEFTPALYNQIVRCFCLSKDLPGTLVAIHALHALFSFHPSPATLRMLVLQISRIVAEHNASISPSQRRGGRRMRNIPNIPRTTEQVTKILEAITQMESDALVESGIDDEKLDGDLQLQGELHMRIVTKFIIGVRARLMDEGGDLDRELESVAWKMGVGGLRIQGGVEVK